MGLIPQIAKLVPVQLRNFCQGLRYPHAFIILLPTFIIGLVFSAYIPYAEQLLTGIGVTMFLASRARWD